MQKRFSKFLAGLLSAALVFSSGSYAVFAGAEDTAGNLEAVQPDALSGPDLVSAQVNESEAYEEDEQEKPPAAEVSENESSAKADESAAALVNGVVEVRIMAGIPLESDQQFKVKLTKQQTADVHEAEVNLPKSEEGATGASRGSARFAQLESGVYELAVSGRDYVTYTQEIPVKAGMGSRVQLYTGKTDVGTDKAHPGLIGVGDVTGDGKLDEADGTVIIDAIQKTAGGQSDAESDRCDLNGDQKVNLLDLNYLTEYMALDGQKSSIETFIPQEAVRGVTINGQMVQSDKVQELFSQGGVVELSPAKAGEPISSENPVTLEFDIHESAAEMGGIVIGAPGDNAIEEGEVAVQYADGSGDTILIRGGRQTSAEQRAGAGESIQNNNGTLCISLKGMVAVKKVTLKITKTTSNTKNFAEISTVEFLNDMDSRIPEPVMNIPKGLTAVPGNRSFSLKWDPETNVTGYEVRISLTTGSEAQGNLQTLTEYIRTTGTSLDVQQFNKDKLKNYASYEVAVQSLNGEWRSGFSEPITVIPMPSAVPPAPDRVSVKGGYRSITVTWTKMDDEAAGFYLYYKKDGDENFQEVKIENGAAASWIVEGLEDNTVYQAYLKAYNELGTGPQSLTAADQTLSGLDSVAMPKYKLINTSNGDGKLSSHIKAAELGKGGGENYMVDSLLDAEGTKSALGLFDNNPASYMQCNDWDWGAVYAGADKGIFAELDGMYSLGMITFSEPQDIGTFSNARIYYWDESGSRLEAANTSIVTKTSGSRKYYLIKFDEIRTSKVQICVARAGNLRKITISEIQFHEYDSLEHDILELYQDDLQIELKDTVTEAVFQQLQTRLDTADPVSGEYHPEKEALQKELDTAKELWNTKNLGGVMAVNPRITATGDVSVGGLNAWQPLGISAAAGEELVVYVGNPGMKKGANTSLSLVYTQYHAESGGFFQSQSLKIGRNQITVPKISSTDGEKGGALYVQYGGNNSGDQYALRVSGGVKFPVLNVYGVSKEERTAKIAAYVNELREYAAQIESEHGTVHEGSENEHVHCAYDAKNCILNSTDIVMNQMMLSIPASQALAGLGSGGAEDQAERLGKSIQAMEEMLTLFYQHKGLTDSFKNEADRAKNHLPYRYLNIRYMRMFAGAFMYASGNHIGIEWNETSGMTGNQNPVTADEKGKWVSGGYFGWGIAHEIGHDINQSEYSHAEVTNNYFSVLAQAKDQSDSVRFQYSEVFKKVTSGSKGYSNNVFTQLGMYWQLHLAYDNGYNYRTYDTYEDIFDNLFFARVDSYARNPAKAPVVSANGTEGMALTLSGDRDQNLMRLASAAAERDLSEFFERWGMTPTEDTKAYMSQFAPEERAIYYGDDDARVYRIEGGRDDSISGKSAVTAAVSVNGSDVTLQMQLDPSADKADLQGYEVTRVYINQGEEKREVAGFTQGDTFTDHVPFASNRVITYEVTAIGKCMNRSNAFQAEAVKINGDGLRDKSSWTVSSNMTSDLDRVETGEDNLECEIKKVSAIDRVLNSTETYTGQAAAEDPYILLELNQSMEVNALSYKLQEEGSAIEKYKIEVSADGENYVTVKEGTFQLKEGIDKVFFENGEDPWICTYDAAFVKLTAVGQAGKELSVSELDLYGPSGDNIEFLSTVSGQTGIGILSEDYVFEKQQEGTDSGNAVSGNKIPEGSVVFTGEYKGNPAYNVVALYDESGNLVGGVNADGEMIAHQIVIAPELTREDALLGETHEGRWIYWIEPGNTNPLPKQVRAELYRVDNALTNEGQRLVSDTRFVELPETLPPISISD